MHSEARHLKVSRFRMTIETLEAGQVTILAPAAGTLRVHNTHRNAAMFRQPCCAPLSRKPPLPRVLTATDQVARRYSSRYSTTSSRTRSSQTSPRASMDFKLKDEPRQGTPTPRLTRAPRSRRTASSPQRTDRSASRRRAGTSARRCTSSTSPSPRPVTASRSAALRRQAGRLVTANRSNPGFGRRVGLTTV